MDNVNTEMSQKKSLRRGFSGLGAVARFFPHGWLMPGTVLPCLKCHGDLIEWDAVQQGTRRLPRLPFWRSDTRRIMVRCTSGNHFQMVFAYRVFNWIPPRRLTTEMAILNALIALLVLFSALPHHPMRVLLPM